MNELIKWQRAEGVFVFFAAVVIFLNLDSQLQWWLILLVFFAPDVSFLGYLFGPRIGAYAYNLVHVYAFGLLIFAIGLSMDSVEVLGPGALLTAHCGFDRMLGYGLKSNDGFKVTHLGKIGA